MTISGNPVSSAIDNFTTPGHQILSSAATVGSTEKFFGDASWNNTTWNATSNNTVPPLNMTSTTPMATPSPLLLYTFIMNVFVVSFVCLVGIVGNTLSFCVFALDKQKSSTSLLLQTLAFVDGLLLATQLPHYVIPNIYPYTGSRTLKWWMDMNPSLMRWTWPTGYIFMTSSNWLILAVTVDRFVAVCKPLKAKQFCTISRARKTIATIFLVAVIFNIPRYFGATFIGFVPCFNNPADYCFYNILVENDWYRIGYRVVLHLFLMYVGPVTILVYLNYNLIRAVKQARERRKKMAKISKSEINAESITVSLIVVVIVYITFATPTFLSQIVLAVRDFLPPKLLSYYQYYFAFNVVLLVFNSAANFFIYCLIGRRFRSTLTLIVCRCCRGGKKGKNRESTYDGSSSRISTTGSSSYRSQP